MGHLDRAGQELKQHQAANFDQLAETIAETPFDRHVRFLNFGYAVLDGEAPVGPELPRGYPNRESAQLLFRVIGDVSLTGRRVGEYGCGRGGNLDLITRYHQPAYVTGLDIAGKAVAFCCRTQDPSKAGFVHGDAEAVPCADGAFDAVVSVETSCTYPDIESFYREVARTIRPGGWFLYTDLFERRFLPAARRVLDQLGFDLAEDCSISANVLAARQARAARQQAAFGSSSGVELDNFTGVVGSELYDYLADESTSYQILRGRRRPGATQAGPSPLLDDQERRLARDGAARAVRMLDIGRR